MEVHCITLVTKKPKQNEMNLREQKHDLPLFYKYNEIRYLF